MSELHMHYITILFHFWSGPIQTVYKYQIKTKQTKHCTPETGYIQQHVD